MDATLLENQTSLSEQNTIILERRLAHGKRQEMAEEKDIQTQAQKKAEENPLAEKTQVG
jgi:hypothetical protein